MRLAGVEEFDFAAPAVLGSLDFWFVWHGMALHGDLKRQKKSNVCYTSFGVVGFYIYGQLMEHNEDIIPTEKET